MQVQQGAQKSFDLVISQMSVSFQDVLITRSPHLPLLHIDVSKVSNTTHISNLLENGIRGAHVVAHLSPDGLSATRVSASAVWGGYEKVSTL